MIRDSSRPALLAAVVAAVLLTSAIAGVGVADPVQQTEQESETPAETDGDAVIENFTERLSTIETAQYTRVVETSFDDQNSTTVTNVTADIEDFQKRTEIVESEYASNVTTVVNESKSVTYNADENTVSSYQNRGDTLLPYVEQLGNESAVDYEYRGTATLDGEDVYVLDAEPQQQQATEMNTSLTVYVDAETYFLAQLAIDVESEDYNYSSTISYENVTLNEEIPDERFELDIPDDAEDPTTRGPDITYFDSRDELESATELSVPTPEVPEEFTFDSGRIVDGESYYTATARYSNGDDWFSLTTQDDSLIDYTDSDAYEEVSLGDQTGYLYSGDEFVLLHWGDDQSYSISGTVDEEAAIEIAESTLDE